jgi:VWFA-related protein
MKHPVVSVVALLLVSLFVGGASAQTRQRRTTPPGESDVRLNVDLVLLDALVVNQKTNKAIGDARKEDFVLTEDGVKQQISYFGQDSLPLSVIVLVDRGGCMDPFGERMRAATAESVKFLKAEDEVSVMAFHETVNMVQEFTRDRDAIRTAVDRMPLHDEEADHCFNRALYEAARYMGHAANPRGRRVIIVISGLTRNIDCSGPSNKEALAEVIESGSVVCAVVPKTAEQRFENGTLGGLAATAGLFGVPTTSLKKFADETGGEIFMTKPEELNGAFEELIRRLRTRYSLGFVSTNQKYDGANRALKLDLSPQAKKRLGKVVVRSRRSYVATPPAGAPAPQPSVVDPQPAQAPSEAPVP